MKKEINEKEKSKKTFLILAGIFVLVSSVLFLIPFKYEATEFYNVQEPYEATEYYYEKEPYTVPYRECTKHSWWTGKCTEYDTFYKTEYKDVKKSRTITKYRTVQKERQIYKKDILFNMITKQTQYVFYE